MRPVDGKAKNGQSEYWGRQRPRRFFNNGFSVVSSFPSLSLLLPSPLSHFFVHAPLFARSLISRGSILNDLLEEKRRQLAVTSCGLWLQALPSFSPPQSPSSTFLYPAPPPPTPNPPLHLCACYAGYTDTVLCDVIWIQGALSNTQTNCHFVKVWPDYGLFCWGQRSPFLLKHEQWHCCWEGDRLAENREAEQGNFETNERKLNLAFFKLLQSFSHNDLCFWQGKIFKKLVSQLQSVKLLHFRTVSSQTLRFSTVNSISRPWQIVLGNFWATFGAVWSNFFQI